MRFLKTPALISIIFVWACGLKLEASSLLRGTTRELASRSRWVGRVQVLGIENRDLPFPQQIFRVQVLEVFKGRGEVGRELKFARPGGFKGKQTISVMGAPALQADKPYVVFLDQDPFFQFANDRPMAQLESWTAYEIVKSTDGGSDQVVRPGSLVPARASRSYLQAMSLGHQESVSESYDDLVTDIYRGQD